MVTYPLSETCEPHSRCHLRLLLFFILQGSNITLSRLSTLNPVNTIQNVYFEEEYNSRLLKERNLKEDLILT